MKNARNVPGVFRLLAVIILALPLWTTGMDLEKGKIIERVECRENPGESYALYLPTTFTQERRWPILLAFEPGARVKLPLELFAPAAEKHGYIVVCPTNSKNGPWQPVIDAMKAVWKDTSTRFPLDPGRVYTTGFSGGARAAALFPHVTGVPVAGIIACGAGLPQGIPPARVKPAFYHGIVGIEDFNYKEFVRLSGQLEEAGVRHVVQVIEGPHQWPPEAVCTRALDWMELVYLGQRAGKTNEALVTEAYREALDRGTALEEAGMFYHAAAFYGYAAGVFKGLVDNPEFARRATRIRSTGDYKDFAAREKKRNNREAALIQGFAYVFSLVRNSDPAQLSLKKLFTGLKVDELVKESQKGKDVYDRAMAKRLLLELLIKAPREGRNFMEKGEYRRAALFFEITLRAGTQNPFNPYNLACAYAQTGKKKKALKNLEQAVDMAVAQDGQAELSGIHSDKQLDPLRGEQRFQAILEKIPRK